MSARGSIRPETRAAHPKASEKTLARLELVLLKPPGRRRWHLEADRTKLALDVGDGTGPSTYRQTMCGRVVLERTASFAPPSKIDAFDTCLTCLRALEAGGQ